MKTSQQNIHTVVVKTLRIHKHTLEHIHHNMITHTHTHTHTQTVFLPELQVKLSQTESFDQVTQQKYIQQTTCQ